MILNNFEGFKRKLIEESIIQDAKIEKISLYQMNSKICLTIIFSHYGQSESSWIVVDFIDVIKVDFYDTLCENGSAYIATYKFFERSEGEYYISFDPDESDWRILESDSGVIIFKDMKYRFKKLND